MKNYIFLFLFAGLAACTQTNTGQKELDTNEETTEQAEGVFGDDFEVADVVAANQITSLVEHGEQKEMIIEAKINECCQKKGCWMNVDLGNEEEMRVTFKDYGFFVPMDCGGKTAVMKGVASYDTIPVDHLRHYAEDAGKSQEEIEAITEPELQLVFEATGVKLN